MKKTIFGFTAVFCLFFTLNLCGCGLTNADKASGSATLSASAVITPNVAAPTETPAVESSSGGRSGIFATLEEIEELDAMMTNYSISYELPYPYDERIISSTHMRFGDVLLEFDSTEPGGKMYYDLEKGAHYIVIHERKGAIRLPDIEPESLEQYKKFSLNMIVLFAYNENLPMVKTGSEKIAGRDTTIYDVDVSELNDFGYGYIPDDSSYNSLTYWVDDEYGFLLKLFSSVEYGDGSTQTAEFEVTEFSIGTVTADDIPDLSEYEILQTPK